MKGESMNKKTCLLVSLIILLALPLLANNISIDGDVTLTDQNTTEDYINIEFDISWDNSWKTSSAPNNWDAAWVFAKWKLTSGSVWAHCTLSTTDGDHSAPTGSTIDAASDGTGIFIYLSADGSGSNNWDNAKLRWNYDTDLVADDATVDVKVFAIEMVNIPQGDFYLGDGSSHGTFRIVADNTPVPITTTGVVVMCEGTSYDDTQLEGAGILVDGDGGISYTEDISIDNANYPTGYAAFYCMKYEISQGQWVDFFNTLTGTQKGNRDITDAAGKNSDDVVYRNTVSWETGDATCTRSDRACNYLSWADGAAYSDWAGLRPMTELEFEKACRGSNSAVAGEYAWGSTIAAPTTISRAEDGTETVNGNCNYSWGSDFSGGDGGRGPLRCGIFAKSGTSRQDAGASYYGVMEMSGNLRERAVTLGNATGRTFTGTHGNGELEGGGNADIEYWPGTNASGAGFRGGDWNSVATGLHVSYRYHAARTYASRAYYYGFRSARTK